jgi:CheY-like chemotaxis protein
MANILLIYDDAHVRALLRMALQEQGHLVVDVARHEEGVRAWGGHRFDLVLCDLFSAGTEGLETIRALSRHCPGVPIVAMSGAAGGDNPALLRGHRELGAATTLRKPFGLADVLEVVGAALGAGPPVGGGPAP